MRALNRMEKFSIWRAFSALKADVSLRKGTDGMSKEVVQLNQEMKRLKQTMETMKIEKFKSSQSEKNMLNIISWLLDMHSGMIEDDQAQLFLQELRDTFGDAKMRAASNNLERLDDYDDDLVVTEVGMSP